MKLAVITITHNEEKIIPFFVHHYSTIADHIFLIDNESTDNTVSIASTVAKEQNIPISFLSIETGGFDEQWFTQLKRNAYTRLASQFDLVIQVDPDEFIHHKKIPTKQFFEQKFNEGIVFFKPTGYQMVASSFPDYMGQSILDIVKYGSNDAGFNKPVIFSPKYNFIPGYGLHFTTLTDHDNNLIEPYWDNNLLLLHYKFLSFEYRVSRIELQKNRLNPLGLHMAKNGIASHLLSDSVELLSEYNHWYNRKTLIL